MDKYTKLMDLATQYCDAEQLGTPSDAEILAQGVVDLYKDVDSIINLADGWIISADATGEYGDDGASEIYELLGVDPYFRDIS